MEISLVADNSLSRMLGEPKIFVRGVNTRPNRVKDALIGSFRELQRSQRKSNWTEESLSEELRIAVRRELEAEVGYKCVVTMFVHRI